MYCPSIFSQRSFSVQWQSTGISKFNGIFFSWFTAEVIYRCINVVLLNIYIKNLNFNYSLKLKTWTFADSYLLAQYFILHSTIFLTYWLLELFAKIEILEMISIVGCFQVGFFPSLCVEVISDKTDGHASLPRHTASSHMTPGLFTCL